MRNTKYCIGIDLGTTYSSVSYFDEKDQKPMMIKFPNSAESIPSWVAFNPTEKKLLVGNEAKNIVNDSNWFGFFDSKRYIGKKSDQIKKKKDTKEKGFKIEIDKFEHAKIKYYCEYEDENDEEKKEYFYPEEISGYIVKYLLEKLCLALGKQDIKELEIERAVIGVPDHFSENENDATKLACKLAGIKTVITNKEPSLSVINYMKCSDDIKKGSRVLVVDFGGGTLDIACCLVENEFEIKVCGREQDPNLGGNDFDDVLIDMIKNYYEDDENGSDSDSDGSEEDDNGKIKVAGETVKNYFTIREDFDSSKLSKKIKPKRILRLKKEAERIKKEFSTKDEVYVNKESLFGDDYEDLGEDEMIIGRDKFEEKVKQKGLMKRFEKCIKKATDGQMNRITHVLPVGGSCKLKSIQNFLKKMFGNKVVKNPAFDPELSVCQGACYLAHNTPETLNKIQVFERVPYKTGLVINVNEMSFFVTPDDTLPFSCDKQYELDHDGQRELKFTLKWGESKYADDDVLLETHLIHLRENLKKSDYKIKVHYDVLENGTINARISDESQQLGTLTVQRDFTVLPEEEQKIKRHFDEYS